MFKVIVLLFFIASCDYQDAATRIASVKNETLRASNKERLDSIYSKFSDYRESFPFAINIEPVEALALRDPVFVDVRESEELSVSRIQSALTLEEFNKNKNLYREKQIIIYCTIGYRSGLVSQQLLSEGYDSYNLKGGVLLWSHFGYKFYQGGFETKKVHVYSREWSLLHNSYQAVF